MEGTCQELTLYNEELLKNYVTGFLEHYANSVRFCYTSSIYN